MSSHPDRRDTRRVVVVGPEFAISFMLKGHAYRDVRITNLSPGGCFALVGVRDARLFYRGTTLDDLVLEHPELPKGPIAASVAYVLGIGPNQATHDLVGIGIQFLDMAPSTRGALDAWVDAATVTEQP